MRPGRHSEKAPLFPLFIIFGAITPEDAAATLPDEINGLTLAMYVPRRRRAFAALSLNHFHKPPAHTLSTVCVCLLLVKEQVALVRMNSAHTRQNDGLETG